jgi:hypothetical protein
VLDALRSRGLEGVLEELVDVHLRRARPQSSRQAASTPLDRPLPGTRRSTISDRQSGNSRYHFWLAQAAELLVRNKAGSIYSKSK